MDGRSLTGRVTLVTGASSGVGAGIALALADAGANVVAAARRTDRLDELVGRIVNGGGNARALELDVRDETSIAQAFEHLRSTYGRLDILVNNAGVMGRGAAGDADIGGWRASIETNLLGAMLVTHAALPLLKASANGHIVNVLSTAIYGPNAGSAPYGAAKTGLRAFTESIRKDLAPDGVRVTAIVPGFVATEFYAHTPGDVRRDWMKEIVPLQPADIGAAVAFALAQPAHVSISELVIRPTGQLG